MRQYENRTRNAIETEKTTNRKKNRRQKNSNQTGTNPIVSLLYGLRVSNRADVYLDFHICMYTLLRTAGELMLLDGIYRAA